MFLRSHMLLILSANVNCYFKWHSVEYWYISLFLLWLFYVLKHVMIVQNVHLSVFSLCLSIPGINAFLKIIQSYCKYQNWFLRSKILLNYMYISNILTSWDDLFTPGMPLKSFTSRFRYTNSFDIWKQSCNKYLKYSGKMPLFAMISKFT